jgi:hypothetical protein
MTLKRISTQAIIGGLLYWGISLILERSIAPEVLKQEGWQALIFALVYGAGLWLYHRYFKKKE